MLQLKPAISECSSCCIKVLAMTSTCHEADRTVVERTCSGILAIISLSPVFISVHPVAHLLDY